MIRFLQTPGPAKKIFLGGLLLLICVALVITLIPGGLLGDVIGVPTGVVATVGDRQVTGSDVQRFAQRLRQARFPSGMPEGFMPFLMRSAAENLIMQSLVLEEAERMGLRVTDEELRQVLRSGELGMILFPGGKWVGREQYEAWVAQQHNVSIARFEEMVKQDLLMSKLQAMVQDGITVTPAEVEDAFRRENTKVKLDYALLTADDLARQVKATEPELRAYFENNQQRYQNSIPEKRKAQYVVIDPSAVPVEVTQQDLQSYYQERIDQYRVPEEVKVRHILIRMPDPGPDGEVDEKQVAAARQKAEDILKQLRAGAKFEDLARKHSDDPGSKDEGGDLGWIGRGRTVPEFEQAAFSLEKGKSNDVVQSSYGFHIIRVDDKKTAHLRSLDEVKDQLRPLIAEQKAQRQAEQLAETLETQARTSGLEKAAAARNLQVITTDFFDRGASLPGVGFAPQFMEDLFAARENSPPQIARLPQSWAVYQVTAVQPPSTPTFEQARAQIERDFRNEQAGRMLAQRSAELSDRARSQASLRKAAREMGLEVKSTELVTMGDQVPDLGSMSGPLAVAFGMNPGQISEAVPLGRSAVVFSLAQREEPDMAEFQDQKEQLRDQVLQQKREQVFQVFLSQLRKRMESEGKLRVNEQELQRLTGALS